MLRFLAFTVTTGLAVASLVGCGPVELWGDLGLRDWPVVEGRVLDSGRPVQGAYVYLMHDGRGAWEQVTTQSEGRFSLRMLEGPGTYELCVEAPDGRRTEFGEIMLPADWGDVVIRDVELTAVHGHAGHLTALPVSR